MTATTTSYPSARELRADVYAPGGDDQRTAVLMFHGGGWRFGDVGMMRPRAEALARRGFTVIVAEYRLLGEAAWPAPLHDVKAAVRWTRANADQLGIEPDRIALQGHSAGGHLSLLTAYTADRDEPGAPATYPGVSSAVAAVTAFYAPIGFHAGAAPTEESGRPRPAVREDGLSPAWILLPDPTDEDAVAAASPIAQVTAQSPPTLLINGTADPMVAYGSSLVLHRALIAAGVPADVHLIHGVGHEFDHAPSMAEAVQDEAARFYRRTVSQAPAVAEELAKYDVFRRRAG